ncbi:hypothetical protein Poli38472_006846 [Pythium oligandrum]|uniref:Uncharacterized protein n=1 Tax=Pythium oligandrum TaxID=41045 RepID=A0A8K1FC60_PYTOL|nr:hypothetical protein Poli38472_006846 [Pythium oligandrum]|eukprot:TMW56836.1 hypothetical protein Poli38472_006846 [Pythium oligandrum]
MRVSEILDKTHQEAQEELERRLLQKDEALKEKDDALNKKDDVITRLQEDLAAFRAEATAKLNEITEQNKETHLQNCALKATADDQRSDIKKLIRFTDNISIKKDNAIAVAEDSRNQTLALSEVALHQHERMYQMCQEPVLNPSNPSLVQGNAWFYRRNADRSIDLVLKVGQRRTVMNFLQRYVGWKQLVEFHLYGSGVNYRIAIKEALKRHVATLIESANRSVQRTTEKATSYIEKYQKMEQQLAVAIAQKDGTVQPIASNNERPDGKLTREQKEAIKQEMAAHNQQLRAEHQQRLDALKAEIREHNRTVSKADVKRSIRSEVAALTAPVLFTSMKAWMAFKGTASAQPDEVSFKELNNRISKVEMEMKEAIPNVDRAREFFAALENVPELNMDTVFTSSRFAVELASSDTHLNSEHNDSELHIDEDTGVRTMVGFTWHNHPLIRFSKIREFLESFDEKAKDVPIVVDEELTSVHILEEILEFLKMEESEDKFEDIALKQLNEA